MPSVNNIAVLVESMGPLVYLVYSVSLVSIWFNNETDEKDQTDNPTQADLSA